MTENEAIKRFKFHLTEPLSPFSITLCRMAIQALEEIQAYRAIGTVEDIQEVMALCKSLQETVCKYMDIGTIDEFKALKEKNNCKDCAGCTVWKCDCSNIRNMAIDEFAEKVKEIYPFTILELEQLEEIAEEMKGGAE